MLAAAVASFLFFSSSQRDHIWQPGASILDGPSFRVLPQSIGPGEKLDKRLDSYERSNPKTYSVSQCWLP